MMFAIGAAASAMDLIQALTSSKTKSHSGKAPAFDASSAAPQSNASGIQGGALRSGCLSPGTMSAMLDAQGSTSASAIISATVGAQALARNTGPSLSLSA